MVIKINTGQGSITLMTLISILSISAITSLPGLAVSPILGKLEGIFPKVSQLEIEMLTSLPSLLIIPFVLLSGKLASTGNKYKILLWGLILFLGSGLLYLVASQMWQLILISALLGAGAGMVIPLSTGLIADYFVGEQRVKQLGMSSSINNLTLVIATYLTGWLANYDWHMPFLVYLLPGISLVLFIHLMRHKRIEIQTKKVGDVKQGINYKALSSLMVLYFIITFVVLVIILNLSFLMETTKNGSLVMGTIISIFFLAIMTPGFFIESLVRYWGNNVTWISALMMGIGIVFSLFVDLLPLSILGCVLAGLGYGVLQPLIYEKTTQTSTPGKTTWALALVMGVNYLAILLAPFIMQGIQAGVGVGSKTFPFWMNAVIILGVSFWAWVKKESFVFGAKKL